MLSKLKSALRVAFAVLVGIPVLVTTYGSIAIWLFVGVAIAAVIAAAGTATVLNLALMQPILVAAITCTIVIATKKRRKSSHHRGGTAACEYVLVADRVLREDNETLPAADILMSWLQALREDRWKPVYSAFSNAFETTILDKSERSGFDDFVMTIQRYLSHNRDQGREAEALADFAAFVRHLHDYREKTIKEWAAACPAPALVVSGRIKTNHGSFVVDSFIQDILEERFERWIESDEDNDSPTATEHAKSEAKLQLALF